MKRIYIAGLAYSVGSAICYVYGQFNQRFTRIFSDAIFPVTSGLAFLIVFLMTLNDIFYSDLQISGIYNEGNLFGLLGLWSYVSLIVGAYIHRGEF